MQARYVPSLDIEAVLEPDGALWRDARSDSLELMGTPVGLQPTEAIRAAWAHKSIGAVKSVDVAALQDGRVLAFRLEWADSSEDGTLGDTTSFPDAAAVLLPSTPNASVITMGAPGAAVTAWYWRADEDGRGRHIVAEGLGTTRTADLALVRGHGVWSDGRWRVVIARALRVKSSAPVAQLQLDARRGHGIHVVELRQHPAWAGHAAGLGGDGGRVQGGSGAAGPSSDAPGFRRSLGVQPRGGLLRGQGGQGAPEGGGRGAGLGSELGRGPGSRRVPELVLLLPAADLQPLHAPGVSRRRARARRSRSGRRTGSS